jgi:hypothetical protein
MSDPAKIPTSELMHKRDLGAILYLSCYLQMMHRELGIDDVSDEYLRMTVLQMVMPMNHATEAIWRALMHDETGVEETIQRFRESLRGL